MLNSLFSRRIQRHLPFVQDISLNFSKNIAKVSNIYRSFIRKKGLFFGQIKAHPYGILQVPTTQLAKMSIDLKFVELTAEVLEIIFIN